MAQFSYQPSEGEVGGEPLGFNGQGDWTAAGSVYQVVTTADGRRAINWTTSSGQTVAMIWSGNGNPPASSNYEMFVRFRLRVAGGKLHEFGPAMRANAAGSGSYNAYFQRHRALGGGTINMRMQEYNSATLAGETDAINSPLNSAIDVDLSSVVRCVDGTITFKTWLSDGTEVGNTTLTDATITQASLPYLVMGQAGDVLIYFIGVGTFNSGTGQVDAAPRGGGLAAATITGPSGAAGAASSSSNIAENATTGATFTVSAALGSGYPTLTGPNAANWAITTLSATSFRVDPVAPFDFDAGGLVNPQQYTFNASASVSQAHTATITNQVEPPLAPTIGTAVAGNASATVAFAPPNNTGRPAITGYIATASPGGFTGTGTSSPIVVPGLANGTPYTFVVAAQNSDGTGPASAPSNPVTPSSGADTTLPTLTGSITIGTVTSGSIQMSWPAGSDNVGVVGYDVSSDAGSSWTQLGNVLTYTFTGLTPSTAYPLRVRARDAANLVSTPALAVTQSTSAASPPPPPPPPPPPTGTAVLSAVATDATGSADYLGASTRVIVEPFTSIEALGTGTRTITTATTNPTTGQVTLSGLSPGTYAVWQLFPATGATITGAAFDIVTVA